eukprot:3141290-Pyramimonas_sp.AAC.1
MPLLCHPQEGEAGGGLGPTGSALQGSEILLCHYCVTIMSLLCHPQEGEAGGGLGPTGAALQGSE